MTKTFFAAAALVFLTGCAACLPEDELRLTRARLDGYLTGRADLTMGEMTILSEYGLKLACMERYMIEYRICSRPGYGEIEKPFMADCERWRKQREEEAGKPSDCAGGSMEPMDRNLRMTALVQKQIGELRSKWLKKP